MYAIKSMKRGKALRDNIIIKMIYELREILLFKCYLGYDLV